MRDQGREEEVSGSQCKEREWRSTLIAFVNGTCTEPDVRQAIHMLARDPLVRVYAFHGDLLRALMEAPNSFWARHPLLYDDYRDIVRAGALARRHASAAAKAEFWSPLPSAEREGL